MIPLLIATLEGDYEEYTPDSVIPLGRSWLSKVGGAIKRTASGPTQKAIAVLERTASPQMRTVAKIVEDPAAAAAKAQRERSAALLKVKEVMSRVSKVTERAVRSTASPQMQMAARIAAAPVTSAQRAQRQRAKVALKAREVLSDASKATGDFLGRTASPQMKAASRSIETAADVTKRVAKRIIRSVLKPMIRKALGADLLGDDDLASKVKAIRPALITAATVGATAAVAASVVAAPAAPAVPVLLPPILDELLDEIVKGGKSILGIEDPKEPEELAAEKNKGRALPLLLGAAGVAAFVVLRKKRKSP